LTFFFVAPSDQGKLYTEDEQVANIQSLIDREYINRIPDFSFPERINILMDENEKFFYQGFYIGCKMAPSKTGYINAYSESECLDLVNQAMDNQYFDNIDLPSNPQ